MHPTILFFLAAAAATAYTLQTPQNPTYRVELGLTTYCNQCSKNRFTEWLDLAASWDVVPGATQYRFCFSSDPYTADSACHVYTPPASKVTDGRVLFNPGYTIYIGSYCKMMKDCVYPYTVNPIVRAEDSRNGRFSSFVPAGLATSIKGAENACKVANETTKKPADEKLFIADVKFTTKRRQLTECELQNGPKWVDVKVSWTKIQPQATHGHVVCVIETTAPWRNPPIETVPGATLKRVDGWAKRNACYYYPTTTTSVTLKVPVYNDTMTHTVSVAPTGMCGAGGVKKNNPLHLRALYTRLVHPTTPGGSWTCMTTGKGNTVTSAKCDSKKSVRFASKWDEEEWGNAKSQETPSQLRVVGTNKCLTERSSGLVVLTQCKSGSKTQQWVKSNWMGLLASDWRVVRAGTNRCISLAQDGTVVTQECLPRGGDADTWAPDNLPQTWQIELAPLKGEPRTNPEGY